MKLTGGEILMECLIEQGVDTVFGFPGGAALNIYDALYKYRDKITHYLTSHEQGASHAADGYARASGKVGVCLATSGPGATNLVTGIATAYMDSVPMVAITANVLQTLLGKDSFQEVDIAGITTAITKHNFIVKDVSKLAKTVRKAFHIASEGRPGPVLIDIVKDVTAVEHNYAPQEITKPARKMINFHEKDLVKAAELINNAERPFIYLGGGAVISDAYDEVVQFAEKIGAPVASSLMGLSAFPSDHENFLGMIGMHGAKPANIGINQSDLVISLGARFSDRVTGNVDKFAKGIKILQIDVDPAEISKNVCVFHSVIGDLREVLNKLTPIVNKAERADWAFNIAELKAKYSVKKPETDALRPRYILDRLNALAGDDTIIVTDVGQHQMWAAQQCKTHGPRSFITSGGLGTMGYGMGAAIGANIAKPNKKVVLITGDGCFRMNNHELATAAEYNVPVVVVIMNNHVLGMVRQWQSIFYDSRYSNTTIGHGTDFVALSKAYRANAINVLKKEEVDAAFETAFNNNGPTVINFEISQDEKVFPMVPPGSAIDSFVPDEDN